MEVCNVRWTAGLHHLPGNWPFDLGFSDLDPDTLSKQLEFDKNKKIHKRKAEVKQVHRRKPDVKKRQQKNSKLHESDQEVEVSSESESDEEQPKRKKAKKTLSTKAATDTAAQAQPKSRFPQRDRKQTVEINVDHPGRRTSGWGASDRQNKKAKLT